MCPGCGTFSAETWRVLDKAGQVSTVAGVPIHLPLPLPPGQSCCRPSAHDSLKDGLGMTMRTDALCLRTALPDAPPLLPELRSQEQHVSRCRFAFSFSFGNHSPSPPTPLPECLMNFERDLAFPLDSSRIGSQCLVSTARERRRSCTRGPTWWGHQPLPSVAPANTGGHVASMCPGPVLANAPFFQDM